MLKNMNFWRLVTFVLILSACGPEIPGPRSSPPAKERLIFVGEVGAGKSTMINSLIGKNVIGNTNANHLLNGFKEYDFKDKILVDTAPLVRTASTLANLNMIKSALYSKGKKKIFFISAHKTNMLPQAEADLVNNLANFFSKTKTKFFLIVNAIPKKEMAKLSNTPSILLKHLNSKLLSYPKNIFLLERQKDLDNGLTDYLSISPKLNSFILD